MLNALLFSKPTVIYEYLNAKEEKDKKITDIKRVNDFKRIYSQTLEDKMILQLGEKDELTKKIQEDTKAQRKMTLMQQGNKSKKQIEKECLDKLIYFTKENLEKILKNNKKIHQDIKNKLWKIEDTQIDKSNFIKISLKKKKKLKKGKKTIEYFFFFRGNLETFKELPLYTFIKLPYAKQLPNRKARLELKALIKQAK